MCDLTLYLLTVYIGPVSQLYLLFFLLQAAFIIFGLLKLYAKINGKPWKIILPQNFRKAVKIYSSMLCNLNLFELWLTFVFFWVGQIIMLNDDLDKIWTFCKKSWSGINFWSVIQNGTFFLKIFYPPSVWVSGLIQKMRWQEGIKFW